MMRFTGLSEDEVMRSMRRHNRADHLGRYAAAVGKVC